MQRCLEMSNARASEARLPRHTRHQAARMSAGHMRRDSGSAILLATPSTQEREKEGAAPTLTFSLSGPDPEEPEAIFLLNGDTPPLEEGRESKRESAWLCGVLPNFAFTAQGRDVPRRNLRRIQNQLEPNWQGGCGWAGWYVVR